jgi:hypothetical protein
MRSVLGMRMVVAVAASLVLFVVAAPAVAQEDWETHYSLGVYGIGAGMEGYLLAPYAPNRQKVYFSDLTSDLNMGGGVSFEMKQARWSVLSDLVFFGFDKTVDGVKVDGDQLYFELCSTFKVGNTFNVLLGGRYTKLTSDLVFPGTPTPYNRKIDTSFADPIVGGLVLLPISKSWAVMMRADVGGFGIASDIVWHAQVRFDGKLGDAATVSLGYRYWDNNYENLDDPQKTGYDMTVAGPTIGIAFNF